VGSAARGGEDKKILKGVESHRKIEARCFTVHLQYQPVKEHVSGSSCPNQPYNLFSEIQSKFTNASGNEITRESDGSITVQHVGEIDTRTIVSVSHDSSNCHNSLSFDSGTQDKVIGLYVDDQNKHTIWESLGFDKRRIVKQTDLDQIQAQLNSLAPGATALDVQGVLPPSILHMRPHRTESLFGAKSCYPLSHETRW